MQANDVPPIDAITTNGENRTGNSLALVDLRAAINRILDQAETKFGSKIQLADDYYWTVPLAEISNLNEPPPVPSLGQISDDICSMSEVLAADETIIWHDLSHVVGILQQLSLLDLTSPMSDKSGRPSP